MQEFSLVNMEIRKIKYFRIWITCISYTQYVSIIHDFEFLIGFYWYIYSQEPTNRPNFSRRVFRERLTVLQQKWFINKTPSLKLVLRYCNSITPSHHTPPGYILISSFLLAHIFQILYFRFIGKYFVWFFLPLCGFCKTASVV